MAFKFAINNWKQRCLAAVIEASGEKLEKFWWKELVKAPSFIYFMNELESAARKPFVKMTIFGEMTRRTTW